MKFMNGSGDEEKKNIPGPTLTNGSTSNATVVGAGVTLVGKIVASGAVEIQGHMKGDIETTGQVLIGDAGTVEGIVKAGVVIVRGAISGEIHAKEIVRLSRSARLRCNLIAAQLEMESGAELVGTCTVSNASAVNADSVKTVLQKVG